ncbi:hypothetical protein K491DRAFT_712205 [Lophiostoma macrostomum CBS 122681]|uniref:HECT-type E3 ubiquitin transferase n=1 Tax=Lophiostoma macrostomum CBS 122681 TaxID=1314788 RepID=A0A6A6TLW0_9PLEO|nr:hypothetical protein K491DRAFT_712205 [Lophiostoma macrostomum CBS 122681]
MLEVGGAIGVNVFYSTGMERPGLDPLPRTISASTSTQTVDGTRCDRQLLGSVGNDSAVGDMTKVLASLSKKQQEKKDVKSLSQNLYDTMTMIYSFSRQIPSPTSIFASLRTSHTPRQTSKDDLSTSHVGQQCSPSTIHKANGQPISGHAVMSRPNGDANTPLPPKIEAETSQPSSPSHDTSSNGYQIHKIRHQLSESSVDKRHSSKSIKSPYFDGAIDMNTQIPPTRPNRSHDGRSTSKFAAAVLSPATDQKVRSRKESTERTPILPVVSHLDCDTLERLKEEVHHHRREQSSESGFVVDYDANVKYRPTKPFVNRSIFYVLSNPEALLRSFHERHNEAFKDSPLPHLNSIRLTRAFRDWNRRNGALIFDSLWIAVKALFTPPPELDLQKSPRLKPTRKPTSTYPRLDKGPGKGDQEPMFDRYLSDEEAAHIILICIHALTSLVPVGWPHTWAQLRIFRSWGIILPKAPSTDNFSDPWIKIIDELEYEPALRLADRLVRGIGARTCFSHILATLNPHDEQAERLQQARGQTRLQEILVQHLIVAERVALTSKTSLKPHRSFAADPGWTITATFLEWLKTIIIKNWDSKAIVNKWSNVGSSIMLFKLFSAHESQLNLRRHMFFMPHLHDRLDGVKEPAEFIKWENEPNLLHLFQYPFLFPPDYLVGYFRTINFTTMFQHHERTERIVHLQRRLYLDPFLRLVYRSQLVNLLKTTLSDYLVLDVSRKCALEETLNQLWGLERRFLLKPLKVKLGTEEGEVGLDHGGITYEFFRVVLEQAFKPDTGMFTTDQHTHMTWFQPASLEPDWKFEMLGILFSLAVYNGITLPITFPRALYYFMLMPGHPNTGPPFPNDIAFIQDGWPELGQSFEKLLLWEDGDVADIFLRHYSFSFEAFGRKVDVDMQAFDHGPDGENQPWPADLKHEWGEAIPGPFGPVWSSDTPRPHLFEPHWEHPNSETSGSGSDLPLVTNANRKQFVSDYIFWLTYRSVAPQLLAFRKGFHTCLERKSLHLFDPSSLRNLVEGTQDIDISALKAATRYDEGYSATHPTIITFWYIVEQYDADDRRRLLEFVTASERVPVTGFESMNFYIVRSGSDTERLPTSSTCFGKLMLPEYSGMEKMRRKLHLAIQNSKGFGVV